MFNPNNSYTWLFLPVNVYSMRTPYLCRVSVRRAFCLLNNRNCGCQVLFFDSFRLFQSNQYCRRMNGEPPTEILSPAGGRVKSGVGVWNACVCLHYFIICCQSFGCRGSDYQKYYHAIDRAGKSVKKKKKKNEGREVKEPLIAGAGWLW